MHHVEVSLSHTPNWDISFFQRNIDQHSNPYFYRLERLLQKAKGMLEMFDPLLGRIEITNKEGRIERVYFEVRQENIDQWEKPQIKESKRTFLHSVVGESGDKEKLECFVNFAEDTIFEMQHAQGISGDDENLQISRVVAVRNLLEATRLTSFFAFLGTVVSFLSPHHLWVCWTKLRQMSVVDVIADILGLIIGLMIGAVRLVKGALKITCRFVVAMTSDPTARPPLEQQSISRWQNGGGTGGISNLTRFGGGKIDNNVTADGNIKPPDIAVTNQEEKECWLLSEEEQLLLERVDCSKVEDLTRSSTRKSATTGGSRLNADGGKKEVGTSDGKKKQCRRAWIASCDGITIYYCYRFFFHY
ncbi:unnamed protein product [Rodentolepis nana]|uniref:WWE domain-containing protein n=1 Tax=Rodentolepis nana TaxID=102285 RepID=A0A0R3TGG6_RODNA|nr:unnamed protein product [Rodentolepis nana]